MAHTFIRPNVYDAPNAQQAHDDAHDYLTHLLGRITAATAGSAHRPVNGDWGHAGNIQHAIDLADQLLIAVRG